LMRFLKDSSLRLTRRSRPGTSITISS
jgi:hypothetical protein